MPYADRNVESGANRIAIIGNGLAGNLAAAYFRKRLPDLEVVIVGAENKKRPIVGESTVELTAYFLHALGLGRALEEEQYHKYGLTYYYKCDPNNPACRKYVVHESPGINRLPAYQLNRPIFDDSVRHLNRTNGIAYLSGSVTDICIAESGGIHELKIIDGVAERPLSLFAKWVVDATGRTRLLARTLGLAKQSRNQRSTFWFRLENFDRSIFDSIVAVKDKHLCFDSYYVTHHLWGTGYWIWLIPLRSPGRDLISIGITYRTDLLGREVKGMEDFLAIASRDHPFVCDLVTSGFVMDRNIYRNYMYEAERYYSPDGWFLIGDAAFPSDPINSAGISTIAHQVPQVAAIIAKSAAAKLSAEYVDALQSYLQGQLALQDTWTRWYEIMSDPVKFAWTLIANNAAYFHFVLPAYINGSFLDGRFAQAFAKRLDRNAILSASPESFPGISALVSARSKSGPLERYIPNLFAHAINWDLCYPAANARPVYAAKYFRVLALLRWRMVKLAGPSFNSFLHCLLCAGDLVRSVVVRAFPGYLLGKLSRDHMGSPWPADGGFLKFTPAPRPNEPYLDTSKPRAQTG